MKKRNPQKSMLNEGYILLEALIAIIIISIFIIALAGLFSSMTKNTLKAESAVFDYLSNRNKYIETGKILFYEE